MLRVLALVTLAAAIATAAATAHSSEQGWTLTDLGANRYPVALNDHGQLVGTYLPRGGGPTRAFLWEKGRFREFVTPDPRMQVEPSAINNRGEVVGRVVRYGTNGVTDAAVESYAFLWRNGRLLRLKGLGEVLTSASEINDRGDILGQSASTSGESHSVLWRNGRPIDLGALAATALNNSGEVIGTDRSTGRAALWQNGRLRDLGTIGGDESSAVSINNHGQIVGDSRTATGDPHPSLHAFLWQAGKRTDLGTLGGTYSFAEEINSRGQVIGTSYTDRTGTTHPFLWRQGKMTDLGTFGGKSASFVRSRGHSTRTRSIDDLGRVVLNVWSGSGTTYQMHPVVWTAGKTSALPTLHGPDTQALAINNKRQIIGSSTKSGASHGVLWTLRSSS